MNLEQRKIEFPFPETAEQDIITCMAFDFRYDRNIFRTTDTNVEYFAKEKKYPQLECEAKVRNYTTFAIIDTNCYGINSYAIDSIKIVPNYDKKRADIKLETGENYACGISLNPISEIKDEIDFFGAKWMVENFYDCHVRVLCKTRIPKGTKYFRRGCHYVSDDIIIDYVYTKINPENQTFLLMDIESFDCKGTNIASTMKNSIYRMKIGKYKGDTLDYVISKNPRYFIWIAENCKDFATIPFRDKNHRNPKIYDKLDDLIERAKSSINEY